jgi:hypothetical protein
MFDKSKNKVSGSRAGKLVQSMLNVEKAKLLIRICREQALKQCVGLVKWYTVKTINVIWNRFLRVLSSKFLCSFCVAHEHYTDLSLYTVNTLRPFDCCNLIMNNRPSSSNNDYCWLSRCNSRTDAVSSNLTEVSPVPRKRGHDHA